MTARGSSSRTYYPMRRGVAVTSDYLSVHGEQYDLRELADVRRSGSWELWGTYRGEVVPLWASRDETEFGQVCRALQRALEAHRDEVKY
ncbi:DUF6232 family protein [Dactylosporangium sp. CS-047395]|uniref:DUF6232 family protein n=1 Tax=Dactylosporangium sp. CS-047395 TaxID=3239936 RepID=UPI003D8E5B92